MEIMDSLNLSPLRQEEAVGAPLLEAGQVAEGGSGDDAEVDKLRKGLEDIFNLL